MIYTEIFYTNDGNYGTIDDSQEDCPYCQKRTYIEFSFSIGGGEIKLGYCTEYCDKCGMKKPLKTRDRVWLKNVIVQALKEKQNG